jgi:hypothetical protein
VIIVGANYLRRAALPDGSVPAVRVVLALGFSAALFVTITITYRAATRMLAPRQCRCAIAVRVCPPVCVSGR